MTINWMAVGISLLIGMAVMALIWYVRDHPGQVAKAKEEGATLAAALHKLTQTHAEVVAKAIVTTPEVVPQTTVQQPGKHDMPGLFIITVTGEVNADLAAINKQYFS